MTKKPKPNGSDTPAEQPVAAEPQPETESPALEKPGRVIQTRESVRHTFTDAEILEYSRSSARTHQELESITEEKDRVVADFKAQIQAKLNIVSDLSRRINNGYEYRTLECELRYHVPEKGMKTLVRLDSGAEVWSRKMDAREMQDFLFEEMAPDVVSTGTIVDAAAEQINAGALNGKDITVTATVSRAGA